MSTDTQTATLERKRHATGRIESRQKDRRTDRPYDRIVPVFERMYRADHINEEHLRAAEEFTTSWYGARRETGLVGAYGDQRWSGTTAGQQDASKVRPEEWRATCAKALANARVAIGDGQLYDFLERVVVSDATLADIGREYQSYKGVAAASAAGATLIKHALQKLAVHYGFTRQKVPRTA